MRIYTGLWVPILKKCFGPLIEASGFVQYTIKQKQNTIFVQYSNFMRMRSNQRMKRTKLQKINISYVIFYNSTAKMTHSLVKLYEISVITN